MKSISSATLSLLQTGNYVAVDLWTITLSGGSIIRWTSHDQDISWGGNIFSHLAISREGISEKTGTDVATMQATIAANSTDLINGAPLIPFIAAHGLDGASVKLERAYAADWGASTAITGTVIRFAGKITSIDSIQGALVKFTVSSWMVLLNINMPRNVFQAACMHTLYDSGCTLNPTSFQATGTIAAGGAGQTVSFATSLAPAANDYALGRIVFSSGANSGISRTVKSNDASGNITLVLPLPHALASGDAFTIYKGCDLTQSTCLNKFNNLNNFKGTPFVPPPRTSVGSTTPTTTTSSGKGGA